MDYSVSNITYDLNGNIQTKDMRGPGFNSNNVPIPATIDNLTYNYPANSNRLASVQDSVTTNFGDGDFQDGNTYGNDYTYDSDGNLTEDLNKGITNVTYTYFDKPQTVTFAKGGTIEYSYNAAGGKVQEKITADSINKTTDYIGNFVYQNDSLQYASTPVGRTVWNKDSVKEEFFVKDHLGNIRSIIDVYHYPIQLYLATYEIASAQLEDLFFDDVDSIRVDKPGSTDPSDMKAGRVNGADNSIGTSILLKVMAGDKVQLNVDNYYDGTYNSEDDQPVSAENMMNSLIATLTGGEGGLGESESHNPELVPKLFNPDNYTLADQLMHSNADPNRPKAFLNYVLFDANMQVVRTFTGAWQANGDGGWQTIGNTEPMTIPENGYLAVYLSNASDFAGCSHCSASQGDVYFDHLEITFTKGHLQEENGYYPFGLPMAAMGGSAMGMTPNRQKYQSNEYITEAGLNWMSFGARQYDPQIGRFLSVDPLADAGGQDMLSPYQAMGDNPVSFIDPDGNTLHVDASDPQVWEDLTNMLGVGNFYIDANGDVQITNDIAAENNLFNYYYFGEGMEFDNATDAAGYAFSAITGSDYFQGYIDNNGAFQYAASLNDVTVSGSKPADQQSGGSLWDAVERWLANLLGDEDEPDEGIKHNTSLGGFEETSKEGGNQETRINTSPQIKRLNIDPIITVATVEKPDAAEVYDVKIAGIAENIGNITHAIEDLNAVKEVNSSSHKFNINVMYTSPYGNGLSADPTPDTNGLAEAFKRYNDSINRANGWNHH